MGCDSAGKLAFPELGWDCISAVPSMYPPGALCLAVLVATQRSEGSVHHSSILEVQLEFWREIRLLSQTHWVMISSTDTLTSWSLSCALFYNFLNLYE